jgi:ferritin-like metal-binding protein YciE
MKQVKDFQELYAHELQDLYSAETQIIEALPKVAEAVESKELATALRKHLEETKQQAKRLQKLLSDLGQKPDGEKCEAMEGLILENEEVIEEYAKGALRDAALIAGCQKIEHYEIAGYGTVRTFATLLGMNEHADVLADTLEEEATANETMTQIAMTMVNEDAMEAAR